MSLKIKKNTPVSFDLLSGLAQELDAPLQSLAKSSQKLIDDYKSRDFEYISYKDFKNIITTLEQMNRQLKRCAQTTHSMVRLSGVRGELSGGSCSITHSVNEIIGLLEQQFKPAKIKVFKNLADHLPPAAIGKVDSHLIIHNVVMNAIQAMPAGGKLKVRTGLDKPKNMVILTIEDEGIGITPEHLPKVFEPFFTTKERGVEKSSGLGLSVVYAVVKAAGGHINIQSSLRKGTVVRIDLPVFSS